MRTATDQRAKKFTARFFHFLRSTHALEELLTSGEHSIEQPDEKSDQEKEQDDVELKNLTIEEVLCKHAGSISQINWLFW
jgi:hypothetical protein